MGNTKIIITGDQMDLIIELAKREAEHQYYLIKNGITRNSAESFGKLARASMLINTLIIQESWHTT